MKEITDASQVNMEFLDKLRKLLKKYNATIGIIGNPNNEESLGMGIWVGSSQAYQTDNWSFEYTDI